MHADPRQDHVLIGAGRETLARVGTVDWTAERCMLNFIYLFIKKIRLTVLIATDNKVF